MTTTTRRGRHHSIFVLAGMAAFAAAAARPAEPPPPQRPAACDKPAYLVVVSTITDPAKSRAYVEALRASGLYPALGGFHMTAGKPTELLEGGMFGESPIVIAKFPCVEAARRFWYSDVYQKKIKPLREGAGSFEVAIFEERINEMRP